MSNQSFELYLIMKSIFNESCMNSKSESVQLTTQHENSIHIIIASAKKNTFLHEVFIPRKGGHFFQCFALHRSPLGLSPEMNSFSTQRIAGFSG